MENLFNTMKAQYNQEPSGSARYADNKIDSFIVADDRHVDQKTVESFGDEWTKFSTFSDFELKGAGAEYFDIVDESTLAKDSLVLDVGCGTGRWSRLISDRVGFIEAIDPSKAVFAAVGLTKDKPNIRITQAGVDNIPFDDETFDLVFSLGVLHHVPDTAGAIKKCVRKVKRGGHFLIYLYYSLDNRGSVFKVLFWAVNGIRKVTSSLPPILKKLVCEFIAFAVYVPMVSISWLAKVLLPGDAYKKIPLSYYVGKSLRIIRNDALDRFGTPLEKRFSRVEIEEMLRDAGLDNIIFSDSEPYWHAVGKRK